MKDKKNIASDAENESKSEKKKSDFDYEKQLAKLEGELDELEDKYDKAQKLIDEKQKEIDELKNKSNQVLSTAAYYKSEAENIKKDFERFKERNKNIESDAKLKASEVVAKKLLPILDNFESAIATVSPEIMKGFAMIYQSMLGVLSELGATPFGAVGEVLNGELHNCISTEATETAELDGTISKIYQKGYKFEGTDIVIRPATVSVYKANL